MAERIGYKNEIKVYEGVKEKKAMVIKCLCEGMRLKDIIERTGVSGTQIREWNKDPVFLRERYVEMTLRMGEMAGEALGVLRDVMRDTEAKAGDRVKAATEVLDRSGFVVRRDLNLNMNNSGERGMVGKLSDNELIELLEVVRKHESAIDVTPPVSEEDAGCEEESQDDLTKDD